MADKIVRNLPSTKLIYSTISEDDEIEKHEIQVPVAFKSLEAATAFLTSKLGVNGVVCEMHTVGKRYEMSIEDFIKHANMLAI